MPHLKCSIALLLPMVFGAVAAAQEPPVRAQPVTTAPAMPAVRPATFETSDGVVIAADYYPALAPRDKKAPVAILVHMYPADRKSWAPLAPMLQKAGIATLAYDIRGTGESVKPADKKLPDKYAQRDTAHFNGAWQDTAAAKAWLSKQPECDVERIALIGASIGCSISLDYGGRDTAVKSIICLSPGTSYFGVDSVAAIKKCTHPAILLLSPREEYGEIEKLIEASGGAAKGLKFPGGREHHGTKMLEQSYGERVKTLVVSHATVGLFQQPKPTTATATDKKRHLLKPAGTKH